MDIRFLVFTLCLYKKKDKIPSHLFNVYNIDSKYPAVKHSEESLGHKICFKITILTNMFRQILFAVGTSGLSRLHLIDIIQHKKIPSRTVKDLHVSITKRKAIIIDIKTCFRPILYILYI